MAVQLFEDLASSLDTSLGCLFESAYDFPGRYSRWSMGFKNPVLVLTGSHSLQSVEIKALNQRGCLLLPTFAQILTDCESTENVLISDNDKKVCCEILANQKVFCEEERSKQNSLFSVVRKIIEAFRNVQDPQFGLYGAFGYNLAFEFEKSVSLRNSKDADLDLDEDRDLVLFLPDQILVNDRQLEQTWRLSYDFLGSFGLERDSFLTTELDNDTGCAKKDICIESDFPKGKFAEKVKKAKEEFRKGNMFEVVLSQTFRSRLDPQKVKKSDIFRKLRQRNPSPYLFLINLGNNEHLIGASPEMYVRVEGDQIETCPISGTIKRGSDALQDAEQIKTILSDAKEESELTMCTDVDRNDKSRICIEGSVKVVGRRQIEKYSKLIHTVDHVVGTLRPGFDSLDAFLAHTWAVTVTGAPKRNALQFIEQEEVGLRRWYGGAVGMLGFDGNMNTGLTLRTIRVKDDLAEVRAGATLLFDSDPDKEEAETELKASALLEVLKSMDGNYVGDDDIVNGAEKELKKKHAINVLVIDHNDSFVNTLSSYFRQKADNVVTMRYDSISQDVLTELKPDLIVLSPGPGRPSDFNCSDIISLLLKNKLPIFGVCLGLQSLAEYFGGKLDVLDYPMHGKTSKVMRSSCFNERDEVMFTDFPQTFSVGRYHSLFVTKDNLPKCLSCIGVLEEDPNIVMAIEHSDPGKRISAVQFHPESIMTSPELGLKMIDNVIERLLLK